MALAGRSEPGPRRGYRAAWASFWSATVWPFTTLALQQKCYAHHHKAIRQAKALHPLQGEGFLNELAAMLRAAVVLKEYKAHLDAQTFSGLYQALQRKAAQLLDTPRREPTEEAVRKRLHKQRDHLLHLPRSRWSRCHQQLSRAPVAPGGHRSQNLLWQ
jgi:hypothetical protein